MTSPVTLYHASPSRASTILWLLEEIGSPYKEAYVARLDARPARVRAQAKDAAYKAQLG